jgi:hypothetical protein
MLSEVKESMQPCFASSRQQWRFQPEGDFDMDARISTVIDIMRKALSDHLKSGEDAITSKPANGRCRELRCSTLSMPVQASLFCGGLSLMVI